MSGANKAAMYEINASSEIPIIVRQVKYLNNIVEQDHRAVKRVTKPMLNFKTFQSAKCVLAGIELMHMIRKGQFMMQGCSEMSFADQLYALVQDKSVQFEEPGFALTRNTFVSRQRDRTELRPHFNRGGISRIGVGVTSSSA